MLPPYAFICCPYGCVIVCDVTPLPLDVCGHTPARCAAHATHLTLIVPSSTIPDASLVPHHTTTYHRLLPGPVITNIAVLQHYHFHCHPSRCDALRYAFTPPATPGLLQDNAPLGVCCPYLPTRDCTTFNAVTHLPGQFVACAARITTFAFPNIERLPCFVAWVTGCNRIPHPTAYTAPNASPLRRTTCRLHVVRGYLGWVGLFHTGYAHTPRTPTLRTQAVCHLFMGPAACLRTTFCARSLPCTQRYGWANSRTAAFCTEDSSPLPRCTGWITHLRCRRRCSAALRRPPYATATTPHAPHL